ncbi:glycosyltransferase family 2 protein [Crenobacter caeni]|uniref:Glycosyltransferase n=1 Tax=Crenobacter caeni TaxID=2705474 RepID=A0A6B2KQF3_9NEIS|nr:glycosyltransferase family 2 protein [Crenobacter caeni]NDV12370.1 glycosyltransferase [Crenobacter caeni]
MPKQPLLSVVVTAHNIDKYIGRCLRSVLTQNFDDYELIVVDDGSTDRTSEVIAVYQCARLHLVTQPNRGVSAARNAALDAAQGTYLWQLDGDDWIDAGALERIARHLHEAPCDILVTDLRVDYPDRSELVTLPNAASKDEWLSNVLSLKAPSWPPTRVYRRALLAQKAIRYPEHIRYSEDMCVDVAAFCHASSIRKLDGTCYHYVRRPGSLTGNAGRYIHDDIRAYHYVRNVLEQQGLLGRYPDELAYLAFRKVYLGLLGAGGNEPWHAAEYRQLRKDYPCLMEVAAVRQDLPVRLNRGKRLLAHAYALNHTLGHLLKKGGRLAKWLAGHVGRTPLAGQGGTGVKTR